jgi:hypothetical protein
MVATMTSASSVIQQGNSFLITIPTRALPLPKPWCAHGICCIQAEQHDLAS